MSLNVNGWLFGMFYLLWDKTIFSSFKNNSDELKTRFSGGKRCIHADNDQETFDQERIFFFFLK